MPHLDAVAIEASLRMLPPPGRDHGVVRLLVQRLPGEARLNPERVILDVAQGVLGDRWSLGGAPNPEAQVTLMRHDVACLLSAGGDPSMLGDNLFVDIDTSAENLPPGTVLQIGDALCAVTPKPHTGCHKFAARVGAEALALTRASGWKQMQLRGVHLRVLEGGAVELGDTARVLRRP